MTPRDRTALVVVAHREYAVLPLCIDSLCAAAGQPRDLIFVDNGSGGRLTAWAQERCPDITVLTLAENRLFCGGYNAGIRLALERGYTFVLIVNADVEAVSSSFVPAMVDVMARWPRAAFVGPTVWFRERGVKQNTAFAFPSFLGFAASWLVHRVHPAALRDEREEEHTVGALNGVCVLCRTDALRTVGLMDETLGAYMEDIDWAWRARRLGWQSVYAPIESIIHHEEPAGYEHHAFKTFLLKRNTVRWFLKSGRRFSARGYAVFALLFARLRARAAPRHEAAAYRGFADQLSAVYRRLLSDERLGPWFGAPFDGTAYGNALTQKAGSNGYTATDDPL